MATLNNYTGMKVVLTLKRVRTDVAEDSPYWHEPLDENDVPTRLSGLPQATRDNTSGEDGYIASYEDLESCALNPDPVTILYEVAYGVNPITQNGLIFINNGIETDRFGAETGGLIENVYYIGDTINIINYCHYPAMPWEANSGVTLTIYINGVEYDVIGPQTVQAVELQSASFVIPEGTSTISVLALGQSTAEGYLTKTLTVNSNTTQAKIEIIDLTVPKEVLEVTNTVVGTSKIFPYNLFFDGNNQRVTITNLSTTNSINVQIDGTPFTLAPSTNTSLDIAKDSTIVDITQI